MPPPDEAVQAASSLALLLLLFDAFFAMVLTLAKALPPPLTAMGPEKDATPRGMATIHSDARREQGRTLITSTWQRQINAVAIASASAGYFTVGLQVACELQVWVGNFSFFDFALKLLPFFGELFQIISILT